MAVERHERANSGETKIAAGTTCCDCGRVISDDLEYVVLIYHNRIMRAPAFYYYCIDHVPEEEIAQAALIGGTVECQHPSLSRKHRRPQ